MGSTIPIGEGEAKNLGNNSHKPTGGSGWRPPCGASSQATHPVSRQKGSQQQPGSLTSTATTSLRPEMSLKGPTSLQLDEDQATKRNITVTVRFRPLSSREFRQGEDVSWYADGDTVVQSDQNVIYAYDRVFAPPTTTLKVYEVAAQHVVSGAMEGIHGTVIAYGVTRSGKTHTMHGDKSAPGIIPLAVKDAFSIIEETPNRQFLLRASYLEIYNEVVSDLLNPSGQNLLIRNDLEHSQGTFVDGIKEEVILSPAHALSLIAAAEERRHDGSANFNLLSSRGHKIFTLTIESCSYGGSNEGEAVTFSQLHLMDLAGPESSMAEKPGIHRKEGSYFNKSLLTLGMVISKLTDGKDTHIPFRESNLTRLLQSSLSGQGNVSLICTVTPASSNSEETHNTLKLAHNAKRIEVQASLNKIIDEKSLIKKHQNEIRRLKEELEPTLEHEEEPKSPLLARIQQLTKDILVSTKANQTKRFSPNLGPRRRHSFGEEEIAYLPNRRRDVTLDDENIEVLVPGKESGVTLEKTSKQEKKNRKGVLNWFKIRKHAGGASTLTSSDRDEPRLTKSRSSPIGGRLNFPAEPRTASFLVNDSVSADILNIGHEEFPFEDLPAEETPLRSEVSERHISQAFQAKDSLSNNTVVRKSSVVIHEAKQHNDKQNTVPTEISADPLQNKQQVSCLVNRLLKLTMDMKQQMISFEKQLPQSFSDSQVKVVRLDFSQLNEKSFDLEKSSGVNHEAQHYINQEETVPKETSAEALRNKQQVSDLMKRSRRLMTDMKRQMTSLEKLIGHSSMVFQVEDSQVEV